MKKNLKGEIKKSSEQMKDKKGSKIDKKIEQEQSRANI